MKATQMEMLRIVEKGVQVIEKGVQVTDLEPSLIQALGKDLFSHLHPETKALLLTAESVYLNSNAPEARRLATVALALACEKEFHIRVTERLAMSLKLSKRYSDYPSQADVKLIRNGKVDDHITPAQVLNIVRDHKEVQDQLLNLSIDWKQLLHTAGPVTSLRNDVAHVGSFRPHHAQLARDLILSGEKSAFRALMSRFPNKPAQAP